ncbi:hypothetical protein GQ44DRAFT_634521 [Phaeosphaeriaceae sp. PMI808]|nr:hypothetical protein GQ44DRAFT_634521 [Phaeosphaeriaceae sp. PMI808]
MAALWHHAKKLPACTSPILDCHAAAVDPAVGPNAENPQRAKAGLTREAAPARSTAFSKKNILSGWAKSGLFLFNPDRVFRDTPKPAELTVPQACEVIVGPYPQCEVVQSPVMLVTPVDAEALVTLQGLINRNAHALDDERSKWRLQWYTEKLANAAKISLAERAFQQDQIQFLLRVNNEAKARRSTKSLILGKAKVMSYEDLEVARAKRAAKEKAKATVGKGKRGRKPKNAVPEAEEATTDKEQQRGRKRKNPESEGEGATASKAKRGQKPKNTALEAGPSEPRMAPVVQISEASEPARAPVARMI